MFRPECEATHINNSYTLFRVVRKKGGSPRTNLHVSKDFNWLQLKSKLNFFFADELVIFIVLVVPCSE